ncbi:MAG TPA: hypothetical protein DD740_03825 [Chryseobacterium sp.]|nr:hypothetical protein HER18_13435 [Chryseobacterium sp. NEB161]HBR11340.1 hypothetical protein [Chryseobacterium sp.]
MIFENKILTKSYYYEKVIINRSVIDCFHKLYPDKGKIDKDKKSRSADSIRNDGVDSAAANSHKNTADTISR